MEEKGPIGENKEKKRGRFLSTADLSFFMASQSAEKEAARILMRKSHRAFWELFGRRMCESSGSDWNGVLRQACSEEALARLVVASARAAGRRQPGGGDFWRRKGELVLEGVAGIKARRPGILAALASGCAESMREAQASASAFGIPCARMALNKDGLEAIEQTLARAPSRWGSEQEQKAWRWGACGFDGKSGVPFSAKAALELATAAAQGAPMDAGSLRDCGDNMMLMVCARAAAEAKLGNAAASDRFWAAAAGWIGKGAVPAGSALAFCLSNGLTLEALEKSAGKSSGPSFYRSREVLLEAFELAPAEFAGRIAGIDRAWNRFADQEAMPVAYALLAKNFGAAEKIAQGLGELPASWVLDSSDVLWAIGAGQSGADRQRWGSGVKRAPDRLAKDLGAPAELVKMLAGKKARPKRKGDIGARK